MKLDMTYEVAGEEHRQRRGAIRNTSKNKSCFTRKRYGEKKY